MKFSWLFITLIAVFCISLPVHAHNERLSCRLELNEEFVPAAPPPRILHRWTKEDVLKVFAALKEKDLLLSPSKIQKAESAEANQVVADVIGVPVNTGHFFNACRKFFGSYAKAQEAAGIEVNWRSQHTWNKEEVLKVFAALKKNKIFLSPRRLQLAESEEANTIVSDIVGEKVTTNAFYLACIKLFGSFDEAEKASKYDLHPELKPKFAPGEKRKPAPVVEEVAPAANPWTKEKVLEIFEALEPLSLTPSELHGSKSAEANKIVSDIIGEPSNTRKFYNEATRLFESFTNAQRTAKMKITGRNLSIKDPSQLLEMLRFLSQHYPRMNYTEVKAASEKISQLIASRFNANVTFNSIYEDARRHFGGWSQAIEAAGIKETWRTELIVENGAQLLEMLRFLSTHYPRMLASEVAADSARAEHLINARFGKALVFGTVRSAARRFFGGWPEAVQAAGLERGIQWTPELVIAILKHLTSHHLTLRSEKFFGNSALIRRLTKEEFLYEIGPLTIYKMAFKHLGGWRAAKKAIGYRERQRNAGPKTDDTAIIPHTIVIDRDTTGEVRAQIQYGSTQLTPEQEMIESEKSSTIQSAIDHLDSEEKGIADALLNYLEDHDDLRKQAEVLSFVGARVGHPITWRSVQSSLSHLSGELLEAAE